MYRPVTTRFFRKCCLFIWLLLAGVYAHAQITVTNNLTAQELAETLVGKGITIANARLTGPGIASGRFKTTASNLGLDSGIVLTTGRAATANSPGMNGGQAQQASTDNGEPGDTDIDRLIGRVGLSFDACALEFDFLPIGDTLYFRYVFGSEEYPDYVCTEFNDAFAFFLSGPGIVQRKNLALVPGTNIPVAINSINSGRPGPTGDIRFCSGMGAGSPFWQYYFDNAGGTTVTYNGFTTVLSVKSVVTPCQWYRMKLVIADISDGVFDTGVMLEAKSFSTNVSFLQANTPVDVNGTPYLVEGCTTGQLQIRRAVVDGLPQAVRLRFTGTATSGVDYVSLPATVTIPGTDAFVSYPLTPIVDNIDEGIEKLKIYLSMSTSCDSDQIVDSISIDIRDYQNLWMRPRDTGFCKGENVQLYATPGYQTYAWTPASTLSNPQLFNPVASPPGTITYTVLAQTGNCRAKDSVKLQQKDLEIPRIKNISCRNGSDGEIEASGGYEWLQPASYSINNGPFGTDSLFTNLPVGSYLIKVRDNSGCVDSQRVNLIQGFPDLLQRDSTVTANCFGRNGKIFLFGSGGKAPYNFSVDNGASYQTGNMFTVDEGPYFVWVKDDNGCLIRGRTFVSRDNPIQMNALTTMGTCTGGADGGIALSASGGTGNFQYGLDTLALQASPQWPVAPGSYTAWVMDDKRCWASLPVNVAVNNIVFVNAGRDTTICQGGFAWLLANTNGTKLTWTPSASLNRDTGVFVVAAPAATTQYIVQSTLGVCQRTDTVLVSVNPAPVAIAGPDTTICFGRSVQLFASGGLRYQWLPALRLSDATIARPLATPGSTTRYQVQVWDANGCRSLNTASTTVNVIAPVKAFAGNDTLVAVGQPLQLNASGGILYNWTPATGLNNAGIKNPIATLGQATTYYLLVTTADGCTGRDTLHIKVYKGPDIYVPSAFSPNGDYRNDVLKALPVGLARFDYFRVFNRWGQIIFATSDPGRGWDGRINGIDQPNETFIWMAGGVDFKGNKIMRKGTVMIVR